jgi:HAD superfamily hydrolase (TIGR01549 family)
MRTAAVLIDAGRVLIHPDDRLFQRAARSVGYTLPDGAATSAIGRTVWEAASTNDPVAFWSGPAKVDAWSRQASLPIRQGRAVWDRVHELDQTVTPLWSQVDPAAGAALRCLNRAGLKVAVVSNNDGRLRQQLHQAGLLHLVDAGVDSAVAGVAKPSPEIFAYAAAGLGVPLNDCIMIGDDPYFDIQAALRAGVASAILIDPGADRPISWSTAAYADLHSAVRAIVSDL